MRLKILDFCALGALEPRLVISLAPQGAPEEHAAIVAEIQAMVDCGLLIDCGLKLNAEGQSEGRVLVAAADVFASGSGRAAA
ncbi:hypothetical protein [Elstera sp.]|jgi:hypothetical protein|uniref:hypothetical protein n=1 Tax=Elstera sp. TaxID=1916664 RepID=UPI0037C019C0